MKKKNMAGLTLIEVMVAAAIIAILAAIAIPAYQNQTIKAGRTDGRTALASVALAQERFFTVNGRYALGTAASPFTALDLPGDLTATATTVTETYFRDNLEQNLGQRNHFLFEIWKDK